MQIKVADKVSLLGQARRRFLGLSPSEASFARRGFRTGEEIARQRLEQIGVTFLSGYHAALEESGFVSLAHRLAHVEADLRGFAFEGSAMGLALLDCLTPWRKDRWRTFTDGLAEPHTYMMHVGLGWALARLRRSVTQHLARLDPLLCWLVVDGYGFHEGYFSWPRYVEQQAIPTRLKGYELRVFDQGLGRSIWFVKGADVAAVVSAINAFPFTRRGDLWSGVGLACARSGGWRHPVVGLWSLALREDLRKALVEEGLRKIDILMERHGVAFADWPDQPIDPFFNVNSPEDAERAERIASQQN